MLISRLTRKTALGITVLLFAVGCQANVVTVENLGAPTSGPTRVAVTNLPATLPATSAATIVGTMAGTTAPTDKPTVVATSVATMAATSGDTMLGMSAPTQAATNAQAATTNTTPYVADWLVYGTPTLTPTRSAKTVSTSGAAATTNTTVAATIASTTGSTVATTNTPTTAAAGVAAGGAGNPASGKALFHGAAGCSGCHDDQQNMTIVGPSLIGVATRAETRVKGMSASDYIHNHIVNPSFFTVQGFQPGIMPSTFGQTLSSQEINDIVSYLLTLK